MREREKEEAQEQMSVTEALQAENNQTLSEKLSAQIHRTPWWMISMAAHVLLLVLMALCVYEGITETEETTLVVSSEGTEDGGSQKPDRESDKSTEDEAVSEQEVSVETPTSDMPVSEAATASQVDVSAVESTFISSAAVATAVEVTSGESYAATALKASVGKATSSPSTGGGSSLFSGAFKGRTKGGKKKALSRHKGTGTEKAVQGGLAWLAAHQNDDGSWDMNPGTAGAQHKVAVTSMALLAFLGDGHGETGTKYGANVKKAVNWLLEEVDSSTGKFKSAGVLYEQGLGTLALNEAYGMNIKRVKDKAIKATQYIIAGQTTKGGWNYQPNPQGNSGDTSVTGFQVQALKQALNVKLGIDSEVTKSLEKAREWVEFANDKNGNTGYSGPGGGSIALCAAGGLMRIYTHSTKSDEQLRKAIENIAKQLPGGQQQAVGGGAGAAHMYYIYYGTIISFQWQESHWNTWNEAMKPVVMGNQCQDAGDTKGSWDPAKDAYGGSWGRTGATAIACLCLEVYYRYEIILK